MSYYPRSIDINSWTSVGINIYVAGTKVCSTQTYGFNECLCDLSNKKTIFIYLKGRQICLKYCKNCLM